MTPAMRELIEHIQSAKRLYMVQAGGSRTGARQYRILRVGELDRIVDDTANVCRLLGTEWNSTLGTYDMPKRHSYRSQDAFDMGERLRPFAHQEFNVFAL